VVDAPCSGVRMLWTGGWLAFTLAALLGLGTARTLALGAAALAAVLAGNVLRNAVLFFPEAGIVRWPHWSHTAVGAAAFLAVTAAVLLAARSLAGRGPCDASTCS